MTDENYGFCPHCGENLKSDAVYCPACGTVLNQEAANTQVNAYNTGNKSLKGKLLAAFVLLVVYALFSLIGAGSFLTFNEASFEAMNEACVEIFGKTFIDFMAEAGYTITEESFLHEAFLLGITELVSAVLAGVSAFFCYSRKKHLLAVGFCVASSIVVLISGFLAPVLMSIPGGIIQMLIGLLVAYLIFSSKAQFSD